jgi:hypothetical protein
LLGTKAENYELLLMISSGNQRTWGKLPECTSVLHNPTWTAQHLIGHNLNNLRNKETEILACFVSMYNH